MFWGFGLSGCFTDRLKTRSGFHPKVLFLQGRPCSCIDSGQLSSPNTIKTCSWGEIAFWMTAPMVARKRRVHALLVILTLSTLSWSVLAAIAFAVWTIFLG